MKIGSTHPPLPAAKTRRDSFWKERADEVREFLLFVDQERLEDAGRLLKGIGSGLKGAWQQIKELPSKALRIPILAEKVSPQQQETLLGLGETVGRVAGFVAVGGHALGGALKVASGHQQRDTSRKLDGIVDMATAGTLAATVAGIPGARTVLAPLAAAFNVFRGSYNAQHGFQINDDRKQLQGTLDAVRSAGSVARLLQSQGPFLGALGVALAPLAGALQAGRGLHDLSLGLKNEDNKKQLQGLVDIASAVGTGLAFASGAAVVPGVVLAVAAGLVKVAYEVSPRTRRKVDSLLERHESKLETLANKADQVSQPIQRAWKRALHRLVKRKDSPGLERYSKAQLAELSQLLQADGHYSRQEERRLRSHLESIGQGAQTPKREEKALSTDRLSLRAELATPEKRLDFLEFLLVAAHFDNQEQPAEALYLQELAADLSISENDLEELRNERSAPTLVLLNSLQIPTHSGRDGHPVQHDGGS